LSPDGRALRNVRVERAVRAFERLGYRTARTKGSHHVLTHPERGILVLPFHRGTVKVGILLDALKKAGISVQEFQELL
jgi:predicted RNA binding protein YcfA (HicA-like mRNA interferase family)